MATESEEGQGTDVKRDDWPVKTDFDFGWKAWSKKRPDIDLALQHPDAALALQYQRGSILDVACGTCELYRFLRARGWKDDYYGIDMQRYEGHEYPKGAKLIIGDAFDVEFPPADTVVLYSILEHVDDPQRLLSKALERCEYNVLINVPKRNEELWAYGIVEYHQVDKTHKHCGFSTEELKAFINASGGTISAYKEWGSVDALAGTRLWNNLAPMAIIWLLARIFSSKTFYGEMWCEVIPATRNAGSAHSSDASLQQPKMDKVEILSDYVSTTSVTPHTLKAFVSQNGFKLLFWRILYMLYHRLYSRLDEFRYDILSRNRQTIKIQRLNNSYLMELNPQDRGLSTELCLYKTREPYTTNLISTIIKDDDIIIDIGANIGYYALLESRLAPNGFVYAIEPVRENFDFLKKNVDLNSCTNMKLFNCGLSNKRGTDVIFVSESKNSSSLLEGWHEGAVKEENVLLTTLDSFADEHIKHCPTLVRMDVEGHEHQIVKGASRVLKQCRALRIVMELHPSLISARAYDDLLSTLETQGFKASAFHDPDLYHIKREQLSNKLRERAHLKLYGFLGEGYEVLHELKKENLKYGIAVLFAREET